MSNDKLRQIVGQPEGLTLEYKTVVPPPSLIAKVVASLANSEGGFLICGVRDDLTIQGIADNVPAPSIVESALAHLQPKPLVNHYFDEIGGKRIYVLEITKATQPVKTEQGVVYSRVGDHTITSRLAVEKKEEIPSEKHSLDDLLKLLDNFKSKATESKHRLIDQYASLTHLIKQSVNVLYPLRSSLATDVPEGKALARLILSSFADTFEVYLSDLLFEIYLAKPVTLKSNSPVTVQEVLDCSDMENFVRLVATKKISSLKKGSVRGFIDENKQIQSLGVFSDSIIAQIDEIFQIRHLYIHNNGRVDSKYENITAGKYKVGDEHLVTVDELCSIATLLLTTIDQIDNAAISKYDLSISIV